MQLFPKLPPAPTTVLDITDLRRPNEFDWRLLESEGVRQGVVTIRGASIVPETKPQPQPARPRVPTRPAVTPAVAAPAAAPPAQRLPALAPAAEVTATAPDQRLLYAGVLSAGVCVAASLALILAAIV